MEFSRISFDEFQTIIEKPSFTQEERFKADSYCFRSLESDLGNLSYTELEEVRRIELDNIRTVINHIILWYGNDSSTRDALMSSDTSIAKYINEIIEQFGGYSPNARVVLLTFSLSDFELNNFRYGKRVFSGKVPRKFGSFRQSTAQSWFNEYVEWVGEVAFRIDKALGEDNVCSWIIANTVYMMNREQPLIYNALPNETMNDTIYRLSQMILL